MKRLLATLISGFIVLKGVSDLFQVLGQGCTTAKFHLVKAPACGADGYLLAFAWIVFGLLVGYLIWNSSPSKFSIKKIDSDEFDKNEKLTTSIPRRPPL